MNKSKLITFVIFTISTNVVSGYSVFLPSDLDLSATVGITAESEKYTEVLDSDGKYVLTWWVNNATNEITFEVDAETKGYVGLAISPNGKMDGADLFIAGVRTNEFGAPEVYSEDYHGVGHTPTPDEHGDWTLIEAKENETHTYIQVKRLLNTCDDQDYPITGESTGRVLWSLGTTDHISYHAQARGTKSVSLIPFPEPEVDIDSLEKWNILVDMTMPSADTSYWCTIHKRPDLPGIRHVVGFEAILNSEAALKHTHHFIVSRCVAPPGLDPATVFEPFVGGEGALCYDNDGTFPSDYCEQYLFVWAVGGKRTLFPLHSGYPIGTDNNNVYYMLEIHYDNPEGVSGLKFETGVQVFYTEELRENEARLIGIGHDSSPLMFVPPDQTSFVISGHCPTACTQDFIGAGGLKVFNILLHSHLSGRKLKLRHFRDGQELPWLLHDDNYDFNFQQNSNLREEIEILPGDHITYECTYDSTWNNGQVVPGGLSTREEMCISFLWVYGDTKLERCLTMYPLDNLVGDFGVTNYTVGEEGAKLIIDILEPEHLKGDFIDMLNNKIDWTPAMVAEIGEKHRYAEHEYFCIEENGHENPKYGTTKYPELDNGDIYQPIDECKVDQVSPTTDSGDSSDATLPKSVLSCIFILTIAVFNF